MDATDNYLGFKVVLCGDSGVGKTLITTRIMYHNPELHPYRTLEPFAQNPPPTILADQAYDEAIVPRMHRIVPGATPDTVRVRVSYWDTPGNPSFKGTAPIAYRNSHAVVAVYDMCDRQSFIHALLWIAEALDTQTRWDPAVFMVGNKLDLADTRREVTRQEAADLCADKHYNLIETSALDDTGIDELLGAVRREVYANHAHYWSDKHIAQANKRSVADILAAGVRIDTASHADSPPRVSRPATAAEREAAAAVNDYNRLRVFYGNMYGAQPSAAAATAPLSPDPVALANLDSWQPETPRTANAGVMARHRAAHPPPAQPPCGC